MEGRREIDQKQMTLILAKKDMANFMAEECSRNPEYSDYLNKLQHGDQGHDGLTYGEMVYHNFWLSGRSLKQLTEDPLFRAFEATGLVTDEEGDIIRKIRSEPEKFGDGEGLRERLGGLIENRFGLFEGALKHLSNDYDILDPLTEGEKRRNDKRGHDLRIATSPDEHKRKMDELHIKAKAANTGRPMVYSQDVLEEIQAGLNNGLGYDEVAVNLVNKFGVKVNGKNIQWVALSHEMKNVPGERKGVKQRALEDLVRKTFEATDKNRRETIDRLKALGYSDSKVVGALGRLGLRKRFDWKKAIEGKENCCPESLLCGYLSNRGDIRIGEKEDHLRFLKYLEEAGVDVRPELEIFLDKRRGLLKEKREQQGGGAEPRAGDENARGSGWG